MEIIGVFCVLFFTMLEDVCCRKIRNVWIVLILSLNLWMAFANYGWTGPLFYLGRVVIWLFMQIILYEAGQLGAGDVKLLAVVIAGLHTPFFFLFWIGYLGSALLMAVFKVFKSKEERTRLWIMLHDIKIAVEMKSILPILILKQYQPKREDTIPMATSVWLGYGLFMLGEGGCFE